MTDQILDKQEEPKDTPPQLSETEQQAIDNGWVPKDQWKGAEDDWVPAKQFIKYGQVEAELKRQRQEVSQKEKVIKTMKDHYLNVKEDAKREVVDTLKRTQKEAIKNEDYAEATKIGLQIDELEDNLDKKFSQHEQKMEEVSSTPPGPPPEFYEWNSRNGWYKMGQNDEMTIEADQLAIAYAKRNPNKTYQDMLEYVTDRIQKLYPEKFVPKQKEREADDINEPGAVQNKGTSGKTKIKLTDAEKEAAAAFGLTYEEFAESLKEYDKKKGWA